MTEITFILVFFFTVFLNKKNKNMEYHKNVIPTHLYTIQKSVLLKTRESPFFSSLDNEVYYYIFMFG